MSLVKKNSELRPFYSGLLDEFLNADLLSVEELRGDPALNVKEDDKELTLELRVLGLKKEDFKLEYKNGFLTLSGEKKEEKEEQEKDRYIRREFTFYSFRSSIELPEERYNVAEAETFHSDGILEERTPGKEQKDKKSKKIEVK